MSENGFFRYAGKLESLPCLVEDHVYNDINLESGNQMVSAGLNNLFGEVIWFYPTTGSSVVNRMVVIIILIHHHKDQFGQMAHLQELCGKILQYLVNPHALEYDGAMIHPLML